MAEPDMRGEFDDATDDALIAEIWHLREEVANSVPRSRYEAADREHKKEMARARRGVEEMETACADYRKKLEELAEWCDAHADAPLYWGFSEPDEYKEGKCDALEEVARRIREGL